MLNECKIKMINLSLKQYIRMLQLHMDHGVLSLTATTTKSVYVKRAFYTSVPNISRGVFYTIF